MDAPETSRDQAVKLFLCSFFQTLPVDLFEDTTFRSVNI